MQIWEGEKHKYVGMPFGLAPAPGLATRLFAPVGDALVMHELRCQRLKVSIYINDLICLAHSISRSIAHTQFAMKIVR